MTRVQLTVLGTPVPQGSKTPWGTEANPHTRPWRATIAAEAHAARNGQPPIDGPVNVNLTFRLPRPKAHYRTGKRFAELRPDAPTWSPKKPDIDKLCRAALDSLTTAGVWRDDSQVATLHARKVYATDNDLAGVDIVVQPLNEGDPA